MRNQEMERVINVLKENGLDFIVEGNKILMKCDMIYARIDVPAILSELIVASQGGKLVYINMNPFFDASVRSGDVRADLDSRIHVEYKDSYLTIEFGISKIPLEFIGLKYLNQSQKVQEFIDILKKNNIDIKVEGNKLMVKGDLKYADFIFFDRYPNYTNTARVVISQGGNDIDISAFSGADVLRIIIRTPTNHVPIIIPRSHVDMMYKDSYLIVELLSIKQ